MLCPYESSTFIISHRVHVEEFCFEGFEILVIQAEPYLEAGYDTRPCRFRRVMTCSRMSSNVTDQPPSTPLLAP